jgi:hypothetical protein
VWLSFVDGASSSGRNAGGRRLYKICLSSSRIETRISLSCDRRFVLHSFADACRYDSHVARWLQDKICGAANWAELGCDVSQKTTKGCFEPREKEAQMRKRRARLLYRINAAGTRSVKKTLGWFVGQRLRCDNICFCPLKHTSGMLLKRPTWPT